MSKRRRFHREAMGELGEAMRHYAAQREGFGAELLQEVERRIEDVLAKPVIATAVRGVPADLPAKRVRIRRFPYVLIVLWTSEALVVLAVAHEKREPGYWRHRIGT